MKRPQEILVRPLITERAALLKEQSNKVVFQVQRDANKLEIKNAIQELFGVTVTGVRTQVVKGKLKRLGAHEGRRATWKKAIVTLAEGDTLDFFEGA